MSAYFPETAVISLVTLLDAASIEAITIGNDAFVGLPVFYGPGSTVTRATCQMSGRSWRLTKSEFTRVWGESTPLRQRLDRYSQLVIETISQSGACNRIHVIEERCARWLQDCSHGSCRPRGRFMSVTLHSSAEQSCLSTE